MMEMLNYLLGGELKAKILKELVTHPTDAYNLESLAHAACVKSESLTGLLTELIAYKFVTKIEDKRGVAYQINEKSPFLEPLRQVFSAANQLADDLKAVSAAMTEADLVLLFGSVAKGTDTPKSDVDILVVGEMSAILAQAAFSDVSKKHNRDINVLTVTPSELRSDLSSGSKFWTEIWSHSVTLKGTKNALD